MRESLHDSSHTSLDHLEERDMYQAAQHGLGMSLDRCLTRDELTSRGLARRLLKNVDLWARQKPAALNQAIESARGCMYGFDGWLAEQERTACSLSSLRCGVFRVLKAV